MASSILGSKSRTMGSLFLTEFKKQASSFFNEKIKTARLALTDVTPAQLMTEEATKGNPNPVDARTMTCISKAAFEVDDYWRIVEILHKRLSMFDPRLWRDAYNSLLLLEHLLTHGPESIAEEFQIGKQVIEEMCKFQYIDEKGFNWGSTVARKARRVLDLLPKGQSWREERDRARKVTREIQGFGSFNQRYPSVSEEQHSNSYRKTNSCYENFGIQDYVLDDRKSSSDAASPSKQNSSTSKKNLLWIGKENLVAGDKLAQMHPQESKPLRAKQVKKTEIPIDVHPFENLEHQNTESRLLLSQS